MNCRRLLTDLDVEAIRVLAIAEGVKSQAIADRFHVDAAYVRKIVRGEVRRDAPGPTRSLWRHGFERRQPPRDSATALLDDLPRLIARAAEFGIPIECPDPGTEHGRRLLASLGVTILDPRTLAARRWLARHQGGETPATRSVRDALERRAA